MGVEEVALVLRDLARRVEGVARLAAVVDGHAVGDVRAADLGPLLELDDHRRVARVLGFEPVIRTSSRFERQRQLELDEDALVGQVGELEDVAPWRASEFRHDVTSDGDGRYRNSSKNRSESWFARRAWVGVRDELLASCPGRGASRFATAIARSSARSCRRATGLPTV